MAIGWAMARYVQRSRGGNPVRLVAYNLRTQMRDERLGQIWDGTHKLASLLHSEVMLPAGSNEQFQDPQFLVNAIDASEKRRDSVVGREFIVPLPRGADFSAKLDLGRGFFKEWFVDKGIPVILAFHASHGGGDGPNENDHVHGFVATRYLEGDRFSAKKALVHEPEMLTGSKRFVARAVNWSRAWREYQERHGIEVDPPALFPGKHLGPGHARNPTSEISKQQVMRQRLNERLTEVVMELSNGTNTISDDRFQAALAEMRDRHADEYETVHNGSGRSEELPSQLRERHNREHQQLIDDRRNLSVAQWVRHYPDREVQALADQRRELPKEKIMANYPLSTQYMNELRSRYGGIDGPAPSPDVMVKEVSGLSVSQLRQIQRDNIWHLSPVAAVALSGDRTPEGRADALQHWSGRAEQDRKLAELEKSLPEGKAQQQEQQRSLHDRYKAERGETVAARKAAEQDVYDKFSSYNSQLRSFYAVQHQQQKLAVARGSERYKEHEVLKAEQGRDRVEAHQLRAQQLAAARGAHPVLTWDAFLSREAGRGDHEAARLLQQRQQREVQHGHER